MYLSRNTLDVSKILWLMAYIAGVKSFQPPLRIIVLKCNSVLISILSLHSVTANI